MPERFFGLWNRLIASDPGLGRLRMAGGSAVSMASALAVEYGFAVLIGADAKLTLVVMLLGAMVAMLGAQALGGTGVWPKVRTALFFPVALGAGMSVGVLVSWNIDLMLGVFVVVMFIAVFIRKFGIPYFFYGFMGWMGYFFSSFLHATFEMLPMLLIAIAIGTVWVVLLSTTVLRENPARTLDRAVRSFDARARATAQAVSALLADREPDEVRQARAWRRIQRGHTNLAEIALMIEAVSGEPGALPPGDSAAVLRRKLVEAQQAVDRMATAAKALGGAESSVRLLAARVADRLARQDDQDARQAAQQLTGLSEPGDAGGTEPGTESWWAARHFAAAVLEFVALAADRETLARRDEAEHQEFEPVVGLVMGNLPGSAAAAGGVHARGHRWNPLARMAMSTRQAVQVAIAGGLAILAGRELSESRYYWAVLAAFLMFAGTATRSEQFIKGWNRVLGTLVGLGVSIGFAELTAGQPIWSIVVIVCSMFCGFYLLRFSYAYMIFFLTIMLGQLYSVLHEFSPGFLLLRLEETAIGAGIGFLVALIVMPLSTRDTFRSARDMFLNQLGALLYATANRLDPVGAPDDTDLAAASRTLDDRMRQLSLVAKPMTRPLLWNNSPRRVRHRLSLYASIASSTRVLAVAFQGGRAHRQQGLAAACRALATAAEELTRVRIGRDQPSASAPLIAAEVALFERTVAAPETRASDPILRTLTHVHQSLRELSTPSEAMLVETRLGNTVVGQVTGDDGAPAAARVTLLRLSGEEFAYTETNPVTGYYRFSDCPAGQYLTAVTGGGRGAVAGRVRIRDGAPTAADFVLWKRKMRACMRGTIRDPYGNPHPDAGVTVFAPDGVLLRQTRTDRNGSYELDLDPGSYNVIATGYGTTTRKTWLTAGPANQLDLRLPTVDHDGRSRSDHSSMPG
ncbi:carboxypeptidase regulatory-like domain-containing protein [Sciscionella marina]|uniref:carboxypeptidase regulatory-like domain-containing protein n=1 Tax=Sciscionella marina TaxID=508770 RepID=UPI00037DAA95|nr:carboxypeptidase regulatory-like domain-containing protein [Sciscionella marina]